MSVIKRGNIYGLHHLAPLFFVILFPSQPLFCQDSISDIRVTIFLKSRTINQVLDEITLQTGYHFTYNAGLIAGKQKVQFAVENLPLENTLDSLFRNPRFAYIAIDRNIVIFVKNDVAPIPINPEIDRSLITGQILDRRSGKPLSYATIALYGTSLGSISNEEGRFSFKVPGYLYDPLLVISFMGYKSKILPIKYPLKEGLSVLLEREMIPLQEVIIRFTDPVLLLSEALSRIPENYLDDYSTMTAYYRESVRRNDHCMVYSEAILDVAKEPYTQQFNGDRVRIRKGRKIADYSSEDSVLIKLRSGINSSLSLDVVKERPDFLAEDFLIRYDFEFTDLMTYGDRLVYVISFRQKSNIAGLLFQGQLYLDQENLAIVAADFEYNPDFLHKEPDLFLIRRSRNIRIRPTMARYHVDYREANGRYHVSQVRAKVEMKVRKRRRWIGAKYQISVEMAITDVIPGQRLRIKAADRVSPNTVLSDEPFKFEPSFWGIHNIIQPEASLMESIQRLGYKLQEIQK